MPRKEKNYHFIYKTTNLVNGKYYYGMHSTDNLNDGYLGSGKRFGRSLKKYGKNNFKREILEFCKDRKELIDREKEIVTLNEIAKDECMNLMCGGRGGFISDENQKNRSIAGNNKLRELRKNEIWRNEYSKNISIAEIKAYKNGTKTKPSNFTFKDKTHKCETIEKMKLSHKDKRNGINNSQFNTCWINKENENKKINKNEIEEFLNNGWKKGRIMK